MMSSHNNDDNNANKTGRSGGVVETKKKVRNRARARKRALAYGSRGSRFAQMYQKPKFDFFFLGISTQKLYQSTKILCQSTKILCQNTKILYQNFFYKSYVPTSQICFFFFLGRTCILYSKYVYVSTPWGVDGHK